MAWNLTPNQQLLVDWTDRFLRTPDYRNYWMELMGDEAATPENLDLRSTIVGTVVGQKNELANKLIRAYRAQYGGDWQWENRIHIQALNYLVYHAILEYERKHLLKRII
jgi:hypothetical protein